MIKRRQLWLPLAFLTVAGCITTGPDAQFFTLITPAEVELSAPLAATPAVVVGPVQLPEVLDRPQIVTRADGHRLHVHEFYRWGGSFADEIARAVQADLVRLLASDRVALYGTTEFPADFRVSLDVSRFDGTLGGEVILEVRWSILEGGTGKLAATHRSRIVDNAGGVGMVSMVAAQSRALSAVSQSIAVEIQRLRGVQ